MDLNRPQGVVLPGHPSCEPPVVCVTAPRRSLPPFDGKGKRAPGVAAAVASLPGTSRVPPFFLLRTETEDRRRHDATRKAAFAGGGSSRRGRLQPRYPIRARHRTRETQSVLSPVGFSGARPF